MKVASSQGAYAGSVADRQPLTTNADKPLFLVKNSFFHLADRHGRTGSSVRRLCLAGIRRLGNIEV